MPSEMNDFTEDAVVMDVLEETDDGAIYTPGDSVIVTVDETLWDRTKAVFSEAKLAQTLGAWLEGYYEAVESDQDFAINNPTDFEKGYLMAPIKVAGGTLVLAAEVADIIFDYKQVARDMGAYASLDLEDQIHIPLEAISATAIELYQGLKATLQTARGKGELVGQLATVVGGVATKPKVGGKTNNKNAQSLHSITTGEPVSSSMLDSLNLRKSLASEEQLSSKGQIIAGGKSKTTFRDSTRVARIYGGEPNDWVKMTSKSKKFEDGTQFSTHWVENQKTGQKVEHKTIIDEPWTQILKKK